MGQPSLFGPLPPREPRTYAEQCLNGALSSCHPSFRWDDLRAEGASDEQLRDYIGEFCFGLGKAHWSGPGESWHRYECTGGENPRLWAVTEAETRPTGGWPRERKPDFQGTALLNAVRELRGIWRAT